MNTVDRGLIETEFPVLAKVAYLNNAASGLLPQSTVRAMNNYLVNRSNAKGDFEGTVRLVGQCNALLAELLGGTEDQYGLVTNTSAGLNAFAHAIDYPEGSNIVLCDLEFPSNYIPWQNIAERRGIEVRIVRSRDGAAAADRFAEKIDNNTRVVAVSHVQFATGYRINLDRLVGIAHDAGAYLVVDIIQSAGWLRMDLPAMGVDFAAAHALKWLLGPIGAGFIYVSKHVIDELNPAYVGWWAVEDMEDHSFGKRQLRRDAGKFQTGTPALVSYVGLVESLRLLRKITDEVRESAALGLADYLRRRLSEMGIEYYAFPNEERSPIVSCVPDEPDALVQRLADSGICCSVREGRLRVSPYFYNTRDHIDALLEHMR